MIHQTICPLFLWSTKQLADRWCALMFANQRTRQTLNPKFVWNPCGNFFETRTAKLVNLRTIWLSMFRKPDGSCTWNDETGTLSCVWNNWAQTICWYARATACVEDFPCCWSFRSECNKFLQRSTNTSSEEFFDILKSMEKLMIFDKEHAALVFSGVVSVPMESWNDTGI